MFASGVVAFDVEQFSHRWFLESLDRIHRAMQGTNDLEETMSNVLAVMLEIFASDRAWLVYPCDPDTPNWRLVMERTRPEFGGVSAPGAEIPLTAAVAEMSRIALASPGAVAFGPGNDHPLSAASRDRFQVRSQMMMALHPKAERPYAFGLHHCQRERTWTPEERRLFEEIGHRLEDALTSLLIFRSLRESERKLEEAQRIAHVGYWERDLLAERIRLSDETCRIFGIERQGDLELSQWHARWLTLVHAEDRQRVERAAAAAVAGGPPYDVEYRIVRSGGEVRTVHSSAAIAHDASGRPQLMFGMMQDITELRTAESELLASETRFRTFVDHATDALFVHDDQGNVLDVNRQACEGLGYSRSELIGRSPTLFDARISTDSDLVAWMTRRLDAGEIYSFEAVHRRKDRSTFPVEVRVRPFWHGGRRFALSLARDITERKRAEEEREQMRRLESERETAIANERTRLAGEIHDTLAQGLAMIVMQLADAEAKLGPLWARAEKPLNTVRELAVESLAFARRSVNMLRPSVTSGGLTRAIRDVVDSLRRHFPGEVTLLVKGSAVLLPAQVESALAGIGREALSNAIRHSGSRQVAVEIEFSESGAVRLIVADKGAGFDTNAVRPDAYGLVSMNERAMRAGVALTFVTEPGGGTDVVASWSPGTATSNHAPDGPLAPLRSSS